MMDLKLNWSYKFRFVIVVGLVMLWVLVKSNLVFNQDTNYGRLYSNFIKFTSGNSIRNLSLVYTPPKSLWVVPNMATSHADDRVQPPDSWGVFVPSELRDDFRNCDSCFNEDQRKVIKVLSQLTAKEFSNSESTRNESHIKIARLLFLLKHKATGILHTSDVSNITKSVTRLIHDDQPYGVSGVEYIGGDLTLDSMHYLFYSGTNYRKPCQYRIRYKMMALWTVGVRCRVMTDKNNGQVLIDPRSPPLFTSTPKFSIENFSDSFFAYKGFWAMFATLFSSGQDSRIWSLWAQRMLQEVEGQMAITPLACPPNRLTTPMEIEPDTISKQVFQFVTKWQCEKKRSFFDCSKSLASDFLKSKYVTAADVNLHTMWLNGLKNLGYEEPIRISKTTTKEDVGAFCILHSPALITPPPATAKKEKLFPSLQQPCKRIAPQPPNATVDPFADYVITKQPKTQDIALVIIFCCPNLYSNHVPLLYDMYSKYFPNILFCGTDYKKFSSFQQTFRKPLTFIEVRHTRGFIAQECVTVAMTMNLDVRGYLQMSDDNILNSWNIGDLPRDQFWFQNEVLITSRNASYIPNFFLKNVPWGFWTGKYKAYGKERIQHIWNLFDDIINKQNNTQATEIVNFFLGNLNKNTGNWSNIYYQASDVFYVPARMRRHWIFLGNIFSINNVFLEIAIPTMIYGLDRFDRVFQMKGHYLWRHQRAQYLNFYKFSHHFMHAWKLTGLNQKQNANFLCDGILGEIVKERTSSLP